MKSKINEEISTSLPFGLIVCSVVYFGIAIVVLIFKPTLIKSFSYIDFFGFSACCWVNAMGALLLITRNSWLCIGLMIGGLVALFVVVCIIFVPVLRRWLKERKERKMRLKEEQERMTLSPVTGKGSPNSGDFEANPLVRDLVIENDKNHDVALGSDEVFDVERKPEAKLNEIESESDVPEQNEAYGLGNEARNPEQGEAEQNDEI